MNTQGKLNQILNKALSYFKKAPRTELKFESEDEEAHTVIGTPFTVARHFNEWYVLIGKYRITDGMASMEDALKDTERKDWDRVLQIVNVAIQNNNK